MLITCYKIIATKIKVKINHFNRENIKKRKKLREINPEREIERMKFYSHFFLCIKSK